jgi:hypothetical protein
MDTIDNVPKELKDAKPQYVALAKQSLDSEYIITVGVGWKIKDGGGIVLRLDLLPTKWDGIILLKPSQ